MIIVKSKIEEMWKKAGSLFEVFMLKDEEEKGFRLQVIKDLAMSKVSIKQQDQVHIGWVALVEVTAGQHVFSRSPLAPAGYLGGPASYMNWSTSNKQTANITQSIGKDSSFICYIYTAKPLDAGMELTWDYGCARHMPDYGVWFKDEVTLLSLCLTLLFSVLPPSGYLMHFFFSVLPYLECCPGRPKTA